MNAKPLTAPMLVPVGYKAITSGVWNIAVLVLVTTTNVEEEAIRHPDIVKSASTEDVH